MYGSIAISGDGIWFQWGFYWLVFFSSVLPGLINDSLGFIAFIKKTKTKTKTIKTNKQNQPKT